MEEGKKGGRERRKEEGKEERKQGRKEEGRLEGGRDRGWETLRYCMNSIGNL